MSWSKDELHRIAEADGVHTSPSITEPTPTKARMFT
jgi:hypothetical protein